MNKLIKSLACIFMMLSGFLPAVAQWQHKQDCICPEDPTAGVTKKSKPDTVYMFTPSHRIVLCGFKDTSFQELLYSEFILCVCGCNSTLNYWNASQTCRLRMIKDTLLIENIKLLPVGRDRRDTAVLWSREKVFFYLEYARKTIFLNKSIRKYDKEEIKSTLKEYREAGQVDQEKMISRLFMASISGSKAARKLLLEFKNSQSDLDPYLEERYRDLLYMLALWEGQHQSTRKRFL